MSFPKCQTFPLRRTSTLAALWNCKKRPVVYSIVRGKLELLKALISGFISNIQNLDVKIKWCIINIVHHVANQWFWTQNCIYYYHYFTLKKCQLAGGTSGNITRLAKVITIHPLGTVNAWTKFHGTPSDTLRYCTKKFLKKIKLHGGTIEKKSRVQCIR